MTRWLLVGLGNPGSEYAGTRHNIGFLVLDELARRIGVRLDRRQFGAVLAHGVLADEPVVLLQPQVYMNRSGSSVGPAASFFQVPSNQILVCHDEIDLPCGGLRLKEGGGHGGHNRVRSLIEVLGTPEFVRLRLGVGRPAAGAVTERVLGPFDEEERPLVAALVDRAADAATEILRHGVRAAMNRFHAPPPPPPPPPPPAPPAEALAETPAEAPAAAPAPDTIGPPPR